MKENKRDEAELSTVQNQRDDILPEEYPEGPYGSPFKAYEAVEGKSSPWKEGQKSVSPFAYSQKDLHAHTPRRIAGAHKLSSDDDLSAED